MMFIELFPPTVVGGKRRGVKCFSRDHEEKITMNSIFTIGNRQIGPGNPVYIVAELSSNHHQEYDQAVRLVQAAKDAGVDAIKLQTATPEGITLDSQDDLFRIGGGTIWDGRTLYDLYQDVYTPWEWHPKLKKAANDLGLDFFSTPYDCDAVDFLENLGVPIFKISSSEIVDHALIRKAAATGKPLILSTGMATFEEIEEAVTVAKEAGAEQLALLKCTTAYPALPEEMHLRTIAHLAETFQVPVGLSDHSLSNAIPAAAVALGACIVEKHLILTRKEPCPDSVFSLEPDEFKAMVEAVRTAEKAMGEIHYGICDREAPGRNYRRSLFVVEDIRANEPFTNDNVRSIRPSYGLHPKHLQEILQRRAAKDIKRGTPLSWELSTGS
jgi:N-acetylneuraminate synthase